MPKEQKITGIGGMDRAELSMLSVIASEATKKAEVIDQKYREDTEAETSANPEVDSDESQTEFMPMKTLPDPKTAKNFTYRKEGVEYDFNLIEDGVVKVRDRDGKNALLITNPRGWEIKAK
ncbi:MAG: hypothetical protein ABH832_01385 [bacterium]